MTVLTGQSGAYTCHCAGNVESYCRCREPTSNVADNHDDTSHSPDQPRTIDVSQTTGHDQKHSYRKASIPGQQKIR